MTTELPVVLTARGFALLESLLQQHEAPFAGAAEIVRRKLDAAIVVFPTDVPANVVTLRSRVRFCVDGATADECTLIGAPDDAAYGPTLLLTSPRGLALIGAAAGQTIPAQLPDGSEEMIRIEAVPYQPEQRRSRLDLQVISGRDLPEPAKILSSARSRQPVAPFGGDDDPGPSAA